MATDQTIGGDGTLFVGEDKIFRLEVLDANNLPVDGSTWVSVLFDVRKRDNTADPAIFSKPATRTGTFDPVRATNTQRWLVTLTDDELNTVKSRAYRHSWKLMDAGKESVLSRGDFIPEKATAP